MGVPPPLGLSLVRASTLRLATRTLPSLAPFDLEIYLRYHFTKVGDQTRALMRQFIADGERLGRPTGALRTLYADAFGEEVDSPR